VARNAHKSILAGIILSGATPRFVLPTYDPNTQLPSTSARGRAYGHGQGPTRGARVAA